MLIFKIFRPSEWQTLHEDGVTTGAPIDVTDGYVHFSTSERVVETAEKHFADDGDLWLLALETDALGDSLKWEPSRGGQMFPHLYRALKLSDILWARPFPKGESGHILPNGVL